ncbi:biopolymer transporter ExbB [Pseudodonghicola flavimaris]|uniref:Biopolymer transporter ExbB n=1 Tax=Pseudodonghicola flavimaris TaxID=3050036 RepID=A0ABT7EYJ2_9RHOB|nr:biopolymer transporter ExbB [Pseudodonghicola flavimaris]MDK3017421.1 biopolymer transporter ExbB [Pseudodonghicola flavimaris]
MVQRDREPRPHFSQPIRQIMLMLIAVGLAAFGAFIALPRVLPVFLANPYLNIAIAVVFAIGVLSCFWQVVQLMRSVRWIELFVTGQAGDMQAPQLLTPLASLLRPRGARMQLNSTSSRSILDSVSERIDEEREITRYIVNLLIFLGLLGTFYGLATTVPAVVDTIRGLAPKEGEDGLAVFNRLMTGLEAQLGGMGVAFSSSLLGLAGSLLVGLLELLSGHGQNRFYRELEEWLSSITRLGFASGEEGDSEVSVLEGVLDHMSDQMQALQDMFSSSDQSRAGLDRKLGDLADGIERMADRMERNETISAALERVAVGQETLIEMIRDQGAGDGMDAESRMRLRSIDVQMLRILEEISAGRQESMAELRKDIDILIKALAPVRGGRRGKTGGTED